jgi:hypothetical protein
MAEKKKPLKPTSIKVDPALYERVHLYKLRNKMDVQDIIDAALRAFLGMPAKKRGV